MAKITRKTAKLFGINAGATGIEEFASKEQGGTLVYSTDPDALQTAFWSLGWTPAQFEGVFAPYYQDRNAVDLVAFYQLAYILQQGIPEWDSATPYFQNSWVQNGGQIFVSLQDNNIGNTPPVSASNAFWTYINGSPNARFPTRTVLLSGTGIYSTPAGCIRLFIRMVGGGGGGASYNYSGIGPTWNPGSNGGSTTFGGLTCTGGQGGLSTGTFISGSGGPGGVASGGDVNINGGSGVNGIFVGSFGVNGGLGGCSKFGGFGVWTNVPYDAVANTGSGGAGAVSGGEAAGGGGAGAYLEKTIRGPASSYNYNVGAGGAGNNGGHSGLNIGTNGATGIIIIDEFYI